MKRSIASAVVLASAVALTASACSSSGGKSGGSGDNSSGATIDGKGKTITVWLQSDAQKRQRLCVVRAVLDTGADCYLAGRIGAGRSAQLAHFVHGQIPMRHDRNSQRRVNGGEWAVESGRGREVVPVVMNHLDQEHQKQDRAAC